MKEALQVMHSAASGLINKQLIEMKNKLSNDLDTYLKDPQNTVSKEQIDLDIDTLKHA